MNIIPKGQAAPNSLKNGVHPRALKEGTTILMRDEKKRPQPVLQLPDLWRELTCSPKRDHFKRKMK